MPDAQDSRIFYNSDKSALFQNHNIRFILTSRLNGTSKSPYTSLNLGYHTGDMPQNVITNRTNIMRDFFPQKTLISLNQIHSNIILDSNTLDSRIQDTHTLNATPHLADGDGIFCTDSRYVALIMVADCNPILLYDTQTQAFVALHAGRAGVCAQILSAGIKLLCKHGALAHDILVFIGASIRACCYEISQSLADTITKDFGAKHIITEGKFIKLDMISMLQDECLANKILPQHIEILPTCTCCEANLFSYRREGITGRFGLFVALKH